ncbi:MAG: class I tRNA ligase family protein, partial [Rickettsiales bacterium]|nr:class I tRNA ligase family protein [Rickettsiales bacterium]
LRQWVDSRKDWNKLVRGIAYKWLDEGLDDRSITRDLRWGVPVPADVWPDLAGKVFYVWFDAPVGYISMTRDLLDERYLDWWQNPKVKYFQFMGKDNVPFHAVIFPAMEIATGEPWHLADEIKGLAYLTFNGGKFSKSAHRGIFADDAIVEFPEADILRWWIMKNLPETDDADFSFESLASDTNKDLNDVFGNLVLRSAKFYRSKFGETVSHEPSLAADTASLADEYFARMDALEFRKAALVLRRIWSLGNEYMDKAAPWSVYKTSPDEAGRIAVEAMNIAALGAVLALPFIPVFAQRVLDIFGIRADRFDPMPRVGPGSRLAVPEALFLKIPPERVEELNAKYGT